MMGLPVRDSANVVAIYNDDSFTDDDDDDLVHNSQEH